MDRDTSDRQRATAAVSLALLVAKQVNLRPDFGGLRGCCPTHPDPSASFYVHEAKRIFHCFACNRGGDAVDWLYITRGMSEGQAIAELMRPA